MPDYVNDLPPDLVAAANRVLGQALSVATAGQLPPGVQRSANPSSPGACSNWPKPASGVRYGDPLSRVLPDLLRDWHGGRVADGPFDQLLRETNAGEEWRSPCLLRLRERPPAGTARASGSGGRLRGTGTGVCAGGQRFRRSGDRVQWRNQQCRDAAEQRALRDGLWRNQRPVGNGRRRDKHSIRLAIDQRARLRRHRRAARPDQWRQAASSAGRWRILRQTPPIDLQ